MRESVSARYILISGQEQKHLSIDFVCDRGDRHKERVSGAAVAVALAVALATFVCATLPVACYLRGAQIQVGNKKQS